MLAIGVLASGSGSNLQAILDACAKGRVPGRVAMVLSDKRDAHALDRARRAGVPSAFVDPAGRSREEHEGDMIARLDAASVGLVCLAGYMRILTPVFVRHYAGRLLNVHPSLLPAFPGARAHRDVLLGGAKVSGCTIHFVEEAVDAGPIVAQAVVPVLADDTEETLARRVIAQEHRLYPQVVRWFAQGRLEVRGRQVRVKDAPSSPGSTLCSPPVEP
ncbi:MAG TPA: phosphoribosylglycinamide formyltransferase [Candidatus Thermoplasmatota archaeon]|nr:phosphoribosylglycinamide formyltransferase [Candidatus Thermoplasmatota archaeon]